jgi:hypothetical protein
VFIMPAVRRDGLEGGSTEGIPADGGDSFTPPSLYGSFDTGNFVKLEAE